MSSIVQARLDPETKKMLEGLVHRLGWTQSQVVREGVRLLAACRPASPKRRIIGIGRVDSGIPDLGSNKKHLKDFGR